MNSNFVSTSHNCKQIGDGIISFNYQKKPSYNIDNG